MSGQKLPAPPATGWPPDLLQDDSKGLSQWLAAKLDARVRVREIAADIVADQSKSKGHAS